MRTMRITAILLSGAASFPLLAQEAVSLPDGTPATQVISAPHATGGQARNAGVGVDAPGGQLNDSPPVPADPPPPPGIDESREGETMGLEEAGAAPAEKVIPAQREPEATVSTEPIRSDQPLPPKVTTPDAAAPEVTIRSDNGTTVEEYRRDGRIYMVVFTPKNGVRYAYLDTDGDGRLEGDPRDGTVQPVYYKIYEWD